ncbi:TPA: NAD-dependent deacylase, partial [Acinetobacter baumannii]
SVYPVAALVHEIPHYSKAYYIDPQADHSRVPPQYKLLNMTATEGMHELFNQLTS